MERRKRQRNDTVHDLHPNKKRKLEDKTTTINLNKSCFEDLSNEIMYEIFEYLDNYHVYKSFFNLTKRFQYFLIHSTLPIIINISIMSKLNFENYHRDIIIPNKHRINILRLSNPFTVDIVFSPPRLILKFIQLKTLILDNIKSKYLDNILNHLLFLPKLNSLNIHPIDFIQNSTHFYTQIFRLSKLKFCKITYETKDDKESSLVIPANECSPIEHLIINTRFSIDAFDNLLSYVPQLRRLTINSLVESRHRQKVLYPITLKHLEYVSLTVYFIKFNEFEILIKCFFQHIKVLRISSQFDNGYLDAKRWEDLIISYMPNLQIFDINHDAIGQVSYNINNNLKFNQLIDQFNSSFWIQRKWFFAHQPNWQESLNCGTFYSIKPYRRKDYKFHWGSDNKVCLSGQKMDLNVIKHVDIHSEQITNKLANYFPNAVELTIRRSVDTFNKSMVTTLNNILPLTKLNKLVFDYCIFPFEQIIKLLCFTPNLHTLRFQSISFNQSTFTSIQQSDTFQYVSKMNQIKNLHFRESCEVECIEMIVNLFPRLIYLKTGLNRKEIASITRFLFSKINNKTHDLFFLCISYTPKIYLKKLKILIKSEKLLDDYIIDLVNYDLYLWW